MGKENLAIHGGKPVRDSYLPYGKQSIDEEDIQSVISVLKSDYLTTGPKIVEFENAIANYVDAKFSVAFSSGTAALHAACFACDIGKNDEVITTPMTFAASANCILYQGATPVFADIDPQTYNISPLEIQKVISNKTKAIIPVDFTGSPAALNEILEIARNENLIVIEDAAHAFGASYNDQKIGSISDMTMFSFHPLKHITTGEGGIITTNSRTLYEKLVLFRNHGITRKKEKLIENHDPWYYEMQTLGYNYRISDIQSALGISQLKKIDRFVEIRRHYTEMYNEAFKDIKQLQVPYQDTRGSSSWHLYIIRLNTSQLTVGRKGIFEALKAENIGVNVHYIPIYYHPYYREIGYEKGLCPIAEKLYEEILTLPLFPSMSELDIKDVIHAVKKVILCFSK
ncbi:UDP-4-amino-4,6-dideoxy-N-acetyl-beta-L-altrosamine transaminase [Metabacillus herbersteinensis]|uniref:UDP-4-amino-4, 6-dideoxy-N-acetyl-beta-L-altrosamine transaminase n=1 Tax=Metabacillus herbersteinensis TaxID=283816 RepID=A0ABV6GE33_9BACI